MTFQLCLRNATVENFDEPEMEGKLNMKIAYIENEKAQVRQWHRILSKLHGDTLQITILQNESEEVRFYATFFLHGRIKI